MWSALALVCFVMDRPNERRKGEGEREREERRERDSEQLTPNIESQLVVD